MAPSALKAHRPADCVPARPRALAVVCASSPRMTDAAAAAPNVPHVPVRCQPRILEELGLAARLTRAIASYPAASADSAVFPSIRLASPRVRTAGSTAAPG